MENGMVIVGDYENEMDAEISKGHLEASGIPAYIVKNDGGGMLPSLQNTGGVQLVVPEAQGVNARRILKSSSSRT